MNTWEEGYKGHMQAVLDKHRETAKQRIESGKLVGLDAQAVRFDETLQALEYCVTRLAGEFDKLVAEQAKRSSNEDLSVPENDSTVAS